MLDMEHSKEHSASLSSHLAMHNMAFKQAGSLKQSEILILNSDCVTLKPDFFLPRLNFSNSCKNPVNVRYQASINKILGQVLIVHQYVVILEVLFTVKHAWVSSAQSLTKFSHPLMSIIAEANQNVVRINHVQVRMCAVSAIFVFYKHAHVNLTSYTGPAI